MGLMRWIGRCRFERNPQCDTAIRVTRGRIDVDCEMPRFVGIGKCRRIDFAPSPAGYVMLCRNCAEAVNAVRRIDGQDAFTWKEAPPY